jgi:hypothetical protein
MQKIKEGDLVAITPETMAKMKENCHPAEIPTHNHGRVEAIMTLDNIDYITVGFPDESIVFLASNLMLLY